MLDKSNKMCIQYAQVQYELLRLGLMLIDRCSSAQCSDSGEDAGTVFLFCLLVSSQHF